MALIEGMALCDDDSIGEHDQDSVEAIVCFFLYKERLCTRRNAKYTIEVLAFGKRSIRFCLGSRWDLKYYYIGKTKN